MPNRINLHLNNGKWWLVAALYWRRTGLTLSYAYQGD